MKIKIAMWTRMTFTACLFVLSYQCPAQSICPWLNTATASGILGGTATVTVGNAGDGVARTCVFQLQSGASSPTLHIEVTNAGQTGNAQTLIKSHQSVCTSSPNPLKGVGNEATLCISGTKTSHGEIAVGRVRTSVFTVTFTAGTGDSPGITQDSLAQGAEQVARQVAGSLF